MLLEEFNNCLPERIVVYLYEQKVPSLSEAVVLADKFALTHKNIFLAPEEPERSTHVGNRKTRSPKTSWRSDSCFYCREPGHLIVVCPVLKKKEQAQNKNPSTVGFIQAEPGVGRCVVAT